ncbi:MAG: hypothetical protein AAF270_02965 [Pseudomonadota bacterium]
MRSLVTLLMLPALLCNTALAQQLFDGSDCQGLGGQWVAHQAPPRLGECQFTQTTFIASGQSIEVGPSVDLLLLGPGTFTNDGYLHVHDRGRIVIGFAMLRNNGTITLSNRAEIDNVSGILLNRGTLSVEGDIKNRAPGTAQRSAPEIINYGLLRLFDGGNLLNNGNVKGLGQGQLIVDRGGEFVNRGQALYRPLNDLIHGRLLNEAAGVIVNGHRLTVSSEGRLENRGELYNGIGRAADNRGVLIVRDGGQMINASGGRIYNQGGHLDIAGSLTNDSSTLDNTTGGVLQVNAGANVEVSGNGLIQNWPAASIINDGTVRVGCTARLIDQGVWYGTPLWFGPCRIPPLMKPGWPM